MALHPQSVLLVDAQGGTLGDGVRDDLSELHITVAASETAARAYLGASAFDVVVVAASMPDDMVSVLAELIDALGRTSRVVSGAPAVGFADWIRERLALSAPAAVETVASSMNEQREALAFVSAELSRIAHALNNPLAVIDGNAQLALELAKALGVDASVISAIEDIQGGSQALVALFSDIADLRGRIDALSGE